MDVQNVLEKKMHPHKKWSVKIFMLKGSFFHEMVKTVNIVHVILYIRTKIYSQINLHV